MDVIHRFKYNGKTSLTKSLCKVIIDGFNNDHNVTQQISISPLCNSYDLIVPVPLHRTRLKERGFNQSLLLAKGIAKIYNLPVDYLNLKRVHATTPQVKLKGKDRIKNVRGAFAVQDSNAFKDKRVLLIDDVYTTGATITECSKTLKKAGAKDIKCLTLARVVNL